MMIYDLSTKTMINDNYSMLPMWPNVANLFQFTLKSPIYQKTEFCKSVSHKANFWMIWFFALIPKVDFSKLKITKIFNFHLSNSLVSHPILKTLKVALEFWRMIDLLWTIDVILTLMHCFELFVIFAEYGIWVYLSFFYMA
jgi:hypothetical protein